MVNLSIFLKWMAVLAMISLCTDCQSPKGNGKNEQNKKDSNQKLPKKEKANSKTPNHRNSNNNSINKQKNDDKALQEKRLGSIKTTNAEAAEMDWQVLDKGLKVTVYKPEKKADTGKSRLIFLKVNTAHHELELFSTKGMDTSKLKANEWAKKENLLAVTNAGMFQQDHETSVGYMKDYDFVNNPNLNKYNAVAAFNRKDSTVPRFQIIDLNCQEWDALKDDYHSYFQSIRMISCKGNNVWEPQDKKWSEAALAEDNSGNAYFIFSRAPYTMHNFIDILVKSPIEFVNAMHLEGGPEASFFLSYKDITIKTMGSWETGFYTHNKNDVYWPIPNVLGVKR